MGKRPAPDLRQAVHIEALADALEKEGCPLRLPLKLGDKFRTSINVWQLPIALSPGKSGKRYGRLPVDVSALFEVYERCPRQMRVPTTWVYRYYYFDLLAAEQRIQPAFWVDPAEWPRIRGVCHKLLGQAGSPEEGSGEERWDEYWGDLLSRHVVQWKSPSAWLDMLKLDADLMQIYGTFAGSVTFRKVPVYFDVTADDVRQRMSEDMAQVLLLATADPKHGLAEWREFTHRLGLPQRWSSRKAQLLEIRDETVLRWLREGVFVGDIAERLVEEGLYPIYDRDDDPNYDRKRQVHDAERTVYALIKKLKAQGRISEEEIRRRPRGRPSLQ